MSIELAGFTMGEFEETKDKLLRSARKSMMKCFAELLLCSRELNDYPLTTVLL